MTCAEPAPGVCLLYRVWHSVRGKQLRPPPNRRHMRNQVKEMGQPNSTISHDIHCGRVTLAAIWVEKESPLCAERVCKLA